MLKLLVILISTSTLGVLFFLSTDWNINHRQNESLNSQSVCYNKIEIITLIDVSGSITQEGFEEIKNSLVEMVDRINEDLWPQVFNFFILKQGFPIIKMGNLVDQKKKDNLIKAIQTTYFDINTVGTNLYSNALEDIEFKKGIRVLIYFSDGHYSENDKSYISKEVDRINRDYDPYVFVIATSDQYSLSNLQIFCNHDCFRNVMVLDDFGKIYNYINDISQKICQTDLFQDWG